MEYGPGIGPSVSTSAEKYASVLASSMIFTDVGLGVPARSLCGMTFCGLGDVGRCRFDTAQAYRVARASVNGFSPKVMLGISGPYGVGVTNVRYVRISTMTAPVSSSRMAAHAYLAMEREATGKHELWEGEVFATAGASLAHNILVGNLARVVGNLLVEGPCVVLPSDMKVYVPLTEGYVYPDLSIVCGTPEFVGDSQDVIANPSVIVDVLSDSTERFDRGEKFAGYRSLPSLHTYLLVSQNRVRIEHYERQGDGGWLLRQHGAGEALGLSCAAGKIAVDDVYRKVECPV